MKNIISDKKVNNDIIKNTSFYCIMFTTKVRPTNRQA